LANPFVAVWKGAPVKRLIPSVSQYYWNSTSLKHFAMSVVIVLGMPKRAFNVSSNSLEKLLTTL